MTVSPLLAPTTPVAKGPNTCPANDLTSASEPRVFPPPFGWGRASDKLPKEFEAALLDYLWAAVDYAAVISVQDINLGWQKLQQFAESNGTQRVHETILCVVRAAVVANHTDPDVLNYAGILPVMPLGPTPDAGFIPKAYGAVPGLQEGYDVDVTLPNGRTMPTFVEVPDQLWRELRKFAIGIAREDPVSAIRHSLKGSYPNLLRYTATQIIFRTFRAKLKDRQLDAFDSEKKFAALAQVKYRPLSQ